MTVITVITLITLLGGGLIFVAKYKNTTPPCPTPYVTLFPFFAPKFPKVLISVCLGEIGKSGDENRGKCVRGSHWFSVNLLACYFFARGICRYDAKTKSPESLINKGFMYGKIICKCSSK